MKNNFTFRLLGTAMPILVKKALPTREIRRATVREYRAICRRAKDIGAKDPWLSCYALGAWFIAMARCDGLSPEENMQIMEQGMKESRLFRTFMGSGDSFIARNVPGGKVEKWIADNAAHPCENGWERTLLPPSPDYALAFDFTACGICKLCRDEGCPSLARYLCKLDYALAEMMGLRLERTTTLADGGERCDFRYHRL